MPDDHPIVSEEVRKLLDGGIEAALASVPQQEREAYEAAQQSVIDARRSANRIEGQLWIV